MTTNHQGFTKTLENNKKNMCVCKIVGKIRVIEYLKKPESLIELLTKFARVLT